LFGYAGERCHAGVASSNLENIRMLPVMNFLVPTV
jgi:hypothetical protein